MKTITILTLSIFLLSYTLKAEENAKWEALIQKNPNDMQVHTLHALRLGLYFKVNRGDLTVSQANEIFENM